MRSLVAFGLGALLLPAALFAADEIRAVRYDELGDSGRVSIIGRLGLPIGRYVTIEGKWAGPGPMINRRMLAVQSVDGKPLRKPAVIEIERPGRFPQMGDLRAGARYVFSGYEDGGMVGVPEEVLEKTGGPGPMEGWHFDVHFVVLKFAQPA